MTTELMASYSAANVFPAKILRHQKLITSCLHDTKILPIHIQLNPTNLCNFNCPFCSCAGRDKNLELPFNELQEIMTKARMYGAESVTITGGGEPLMYKDWSKLLPFLSRINLQSGLVTNGVYLDKLRPKAQLVWCRISSSDYLEAQLQRLGKTLDEWFNILHNAVKRNPQIDWAFSHVLTPKANPPFLARLVHFANHHNFTHTRIVSDILNPKPLTIKMQTVKHHLRNNGVNDQKVIYQSRSEWVHGQNPCYISLLKPVVGPDGYLYPCCGTQYALENPSRDYERSMRMGLAQNIDEVVRSQSFFDGSVCAKCYYSDYNWALGVLLSNMSHEKFV